MTYKERALTAWKKLAWKYRNPEGQTFRENKSCPLCLVYFYLGIKRWRPPNLANYCRGCPMGDKDGYMGCVDFKTYGGGPERDYAARAKFFEKTLPMLEKVPARYFTPSGWRFSQFKFLDRSW